MKIAVIGGPRSGKTTIANSIAFTAKVPVIQWQESNPSKVKDLKIEDLALVREDAGKVSYVTPDGLKNGVILETDAEGVSLLAKACPDESIAVVHITFPDDEAVKSYANVLGNENDAIAFAHCANVYELPKDKNVIVLYRYNQDYTPDRAAMFAAQMAAEIRLKKNVEAIVRYGISQGWFNMRNGRIDAQVSDDCYVETGSPEIITDLIRSTDKSFRILAESFLSDNFDIQKLIDEQA